MNAGWLLLPVLLLLAIAAQAFFHEKRLYRYNKKRFLMTRAEADLYRKLSTIYGKYYMIVPQVRLSSLLNEKIRGQNWKAALAHINQKSVDFALLDRNTLEIKCAIECDDFTHNRSDRITRDSEVNRIFKEAGLPLFRLKNTLNKNCAQIKKDIDKQKTQVL